MLQQFDANGSATLTWALLGRAEACKNGGCWHGVAVLAYDGDVDEGIGAVEPGGTAIEEVLDGVGGTCRRACRRLIVSCVRG